MADRSTTVRLTMSTEPAFDASCQRLAQMSTAGGLPKLKTKARPKVRRLTQKDKRKRRKRR
jgi:hypothetical protein